MPRSGGDHGDPIAASVQPINLLVRHPPQPRRSRGARPGLSDRTQRCPGTGFACRPPARLARLLDRVRRASNGSLAGGQDVGIPNASTAPSRSPASGADTLVARFCDSYSQRSSSQSLNMRMVGSSGMVTDTALTLCRTRLTSSANRITLDQMPANIGISCSTVRTCPIVVGSPVLHAALSTVDAARLASATSRWSRSWFYPSR